MEILKSEALPKERLNGEMKPSNRGEATRDYIHIGPLNMALMIVTNSCPYYSPVVYIN
jgi:hypothetical protein